MVVIIFAFVIVGYRDQLRSSGRFILLLYIFLNVVLTTTKMHKPIKTISFITLENYSYPLRLRRPLLKNLHGQLFSISKCLKNFTSQCNLTHWRFDHVSISNVAKKSSPYNRQLLQPLYFFKKHCLSQVPYCSLFQSWYSRYSRLRVCSMLVEFILDTKRVSKK